MTDATLFEDAPPRSLVPVTMDTLFARLDAMLRPDAALLRSPRPRANVLAEQQFDVYLAEMRSGGKVTKIQLVDYSLKHGVFDPEVESPILHWCA